jgi:hypothetical protein
MPRPIEEPTVKEHSDEVVTTHPAFGQIGASRVSGDTYLYGSDFAHHHYVTISISRSELHRNLNRDWHFGRNELIEVALSEAQWATFVSSMNVGSGVPCTIQHVAHQMTPGLPAPQKQVDKFAQEMKDTMAEMMANVETMRKEVKELGISQKKAAALDMNLQVLHGRLESNYSWVAKQFDEHMETTVEKAKVEVNAYVINQVQRAGLQALKAPILGLPSSSPLVIENPT